jgi:hypothetical protein
MPPDTSKLTTCSSHTVVDIPRHRWRKAHPTAALRTCGECVSHFDRPPGLTQIAKTGPHRTDLTQLTTIPTLTFDHRLQCQQSDRIASPAVSEVLAQCIQQCTSSEVSLRSEVSGYRSLCPSAQTLVINQVSLKTPHLSCNFLHQVTILKSIVVENVAASSMTKLTWALLSADFGNTLTTTQLKRHDRKRLRRSKTKIAKVLSEPFRRFAGLLQRGGMWNNISKQL